MRQACALLLLLGACGTPGRNLILDVQEAPRPTAARLVQAEVGRLLAADPDASRRAEQALTRLDEEGRTALAAHARQVPAERDPRWLLVLEENGLLPDLEGDLLLDYLLWKVSRDEDFYVMKAQSRLLDLARSRPTLLLERLERGGRGTEALAVALAVAGERRAVGPLLLRYRHARSDAERRVAAEALAHLVGEARRPRLKGAPEDIREDAEAIERWLAEGGSDG